MPSFAIVGQSFPCVTKEWDSLTMKSKFKIRIRKRLEEITRLWDKKPNYDINSQTLPDHRAEKSPKNNAVAPSLHIVYPVLRRYLF